MSIRFLTAGDSHGNTLAGIIEGVPAGVRLIAADIQKDLRRRRKSFGRSGRQIVEDDTVTVVGGLWRGRTTGAPLSILIPNNDRTVKGKLGTVPRPGHADLPGCLKYALSEIAPVSERASARSTAMRVAIGAVAKTVLRQFPVDVVGHVLSIGNIAAKRTPADFGRLKSRTARSPVFCADKTASREMVREIKSASAAGDSLGGSVEVVVIGLPPGLGSHVEWDRRLDGALAGAMMSIHSVKAVEIGDGIASSRRRGSDARDQMRLVNGGVVRQSNVAGGIEGGTTNGEHLVIRLYGKPVPTTPRRAKSFDLKTLKSADAPYVRSDVCVIPALSVIAESVAAWEILRVLTEKFGGDHVDDTLAAFRRYSQAIEGRFRR